MISICMIVKNEEKVLVKCLEKLVSYGYEIVIVDTGSTDRTKEIALQYTDNVYDYLWTNDFSDARNYAISKANNEYILIIDADEVIKVLDKDTIEKLIYNNQESIGRIICNNLYTRDNDEFNESVWVSRIFPKSIYHYEGMIHEQIVHKNGEEPTFYNTPIEISHSGYDGDIKQRTNKALRNIELLSQLLDRDGEDPYIIYQLGKSYYMKEDYIKASDLFELALEFDLDLRLEYVQDLVESYGYALIRSSKYSQAMRLLNVYDEFSKSADFVFLIALILMNNGKFTDAINEFYKATKMDVYKMDGVTSYRANYNIGVIYECLGEISKAKTFYKKCVSYEPAINRLHNLL